MMYFWLCVVILLSVIETLTTDVVTIWFIVSGLVTLGLSFFIDNFIIQLALFTLLGILLLITTRPLIKKLLKKEDVKTNLDRVIGMEGIVTEKITKNSVGEVKVDGKKWSAVSNKTIEEGTLVTILEIDGVKLKVKEVEGE